LGKDESKRLILAIALTFVILAVWRVLFIKEVPPPPTAPTPASAPASSQANPAAPAAAAPAKPVPAFSTQPLQGSKEEDIVAENDLYRITFSTRGALIKSWVLKKYVDEDDKPLDVVNQAACAQLGYPMALTLPDPALAGKLNGALYAAKASPPGAASDASPAGESRLTSGETLHAPATLRFTYSDGHTQVEKRFTFGSSYEVKVEVSAFSAADYLPVGVRWAGGFGDYSLGPKTFSLHSKAAYNSGGNLTTVEEKKLKTSFSVPGPLSYAGLEDLYFIDMFLPQSPEDVFRLARRSWSPANWTDKELPAPFEAELAASTGRPLEFGLFVAPKSVDLLRAMNPPLDDLISFGWFSFIAKPLFLGLRYIHDDWIHNWGWAIIILTVALNFALFPLKLKSIHSAQKMQKVAPIVKRIQDQYKQYKFNDPRKQKMNQEVMKVYQEHGINPLGGCLPMVLQLPILYGFYELLETVIELRHAPWIGCVKDLSLPDACHPFGIPLPLLPTLMIVSMFVMQKMTPMTAADPAQQRMMMLMPLVFGAIFYRLASGLVLYYMTANLVGIAQQLIINRFIPVTAPAGGSAPPANRSSAKRPGQPASRKPASVKG
jgi:YidC/Oxa1 family membrane protein insertase